MRLHRSNEDGPTASPPQGALVMQLSTGMSGISSPITLSNAATATANNVLTSPRVRSPAHATTDGPIRAAAFGDPFVRGSMHQCDYDVPQPNAVGDARTVATERVRVLEARGNYGGELVPDGSHKTYWQCGLKGPPVRRSEQPYYQ